MEEYDESVKARVKEILDSPEFRPLTDKELLDAGLELKSTPESLQRKYAGGPDENLMEKLKRPLKTVRVPIEHDDWEEVGELCERYELSADSVCQALLRWALERRAEWEPKK